MKSARIVELDGVRGVAIIMVLVWHYYTAQTGPTEPLSIADAFRSFTELFWSGVDLFFVLSGFLLAAVFRSETAFVFLQAQRRAVSVVLGVMVLVTLWRAAHGGFGQFGHDAGAAFAFTWFAALYTVFLLFVLIYRGTAVTAGLRWSWICFFGSISYGLYLYHQPVSGLLHGWLRGGSVPHFGAVPLLTLVVSVALAWVSFRYVEPLFLRHGRRHNYGGSD